MRFVWAENRSGSQKMERLSEISSATASVLARNAILLVVLLGLVLAFAIYIYMTPKVMEFFTGAPAKEKQQQPLQPVRAEPPEQPREAQ